MVEKINKKWRPVIIAKSTNYLSWLWSQLITAKYFQACFLFFFFFLAACISE